jgi:hypothetical protein
MEENTEGPQLNAWRDLARTSGVGPRAIVFFEGLDEPWKGRDDKWGLFTAAQCESPRESWRLVGPSAASSRKLPLP